MPPHDSALPHHDPDRCRCCAAANQAARLMSGNEWSRRFRPLTRVIESDALLQGCFEQVPVQSGSAEYEEARSTRRLWALAVKESGHYIVPGDGDGCRCVMAYYRTEEAWDEQTPSVAWWVFQDVPSLEEIVNRHFEQSRAGRSA